MSQLPIVDAAKRVGRSPKTLYRLVSTGVLSATTDVNGKKQIDTAELLRVFGDLRPEREKHESHETIPMSQRETPDATMRLALLEAELRHARELLESKDAQIQVLHKALLMLEDRREPKARRLWPW